MPHPALGEDSRNRRSHCLWRRPQLLKTTGKLLGSSPISLSVVASCVRLQLRPRPSARITRLRQYCQALRDPSRPGRSLTGCQLIRTAITAGTSRVASDPLCLHAVANAPAGRMELIRSYDSIGFGLRRNRSGSAPALRFSRRAQRLLTLRPACAPGRLCDPLHRRLQQLRCLRRCFDCYRVERTGSRTGLTPAVDHHLFTAHPVYAPIRTHHDVARVCRASHQ